MKFNDPHIDLYLTLFRRKVIGLIITKKTHLRKNCHIRVFVYIQFCSFFNSANLETLCQATNVTRTQTDLLKFGSPSFKTKGNQ